LGERDWLLQNRDGINYYLDEGHVDGARLLDRIEGLIAETHPRLRERLDFVVIPYADYNEVRPIDPEEIPHQGAVVAAQGGRNNGQGILCLWGRRTSEYPVDDPNLSLEIIEHELAHVSTDDHSVPQELRLRWQQAREDDLTAQQQLPALEMQTQVVRVQGIRRRFEREHPWINHYPSGLPDFERQLREDWAESMSFYLSSERNHGLTSETGEQMDFAIYYPHRSQLLDEWLGSEPKAANTPD